MTRKWINPPLVFEETIPKIEPTITKNAAINFNIFNPLSILVFPSPPQYLSKYTIELRIQFFIMIKMVLKNDLRRNKLD